MPYAVDDVEGERRSEHSLRGASAVDTRTNAAAAMIKWQQQTLPAKSTSLDDAEADGGSLAHCSRIDQLLGVALDIAENVF